MTDQVIHLTFNTHTVRVSRIGTLTKCWKYDRDHVDYEVFTDDSSAMDYIITPFEELSWHIEFD
jgi:hypothetical protein